MHMAALDYQIDFVIPNSFRDNMLTSPVMLKRVQHDETKGARNRRQGSAACQP
jgi:hypothetical protein